MTYQGHLGVQKFAGTKEEYWECIDEVYKGTQSNVLWGKIRKNVFETFHVGLIFTRILLSSEHSHMGFIFPGGNFCKEGNIAKYAKITHPENCPRL